VSCNLWLFIGTTGRPSPAGGFRLRGRTPHLRDEADVGGEACTTGKNVTSNISSFISYVHENGNFWYSNWTEHETEEFVSLLYWCRLLVNQHYLSISLQICWKKRCKCVGWDRCSWPCPPMVRLHYPQKLTDAYYLSCALKLYKIIWMGKRHWFSYQII
jgi:hypothetical protein